MASIPPEQSPKNDPQVTTLLDTLSHHIRREIITYFEHHADAKTATRDELVEHLHNRIPETTRTNLEIQLVHNHLPKLAERNWIEYNARSTIIRYHGHNTAPHLIEGLHTLFTT